ncbi:MAG TPA: hypothetical protein DCF68_16695 [Cyanothece sp. UBA12306]|nr:hypothetical protein [Cyanothece sp. UBA12306]
MKVIKLELNPDPLYCEDEVIIYTNKQNITYELIQPYLKGHSLCLENWISSEDGWRFTIESQREFFGNDPNLFEAPKK